MSLHPQAAAFLQCMAEDHSPQVQEMSVAQVRSMVLPIAGESERVGGVLSEHVPSPAGEVRIRVFTPLFETAELDEPDYPDKGHPMIMFFHGGGWVAGSIETHEDICRRLANETRSVVVSVDYRLAPEHKFPAGLDDCRAATQWAYDRAGRLGGDPERLYVCGDSAGGNLAAALCLQAREEHGPPIRGQILIYPITDFNFERPSYRDNASGYHLTTENMKWFWRQYLERETDGEHPHASPLRADDLAGLPSALVVTVEYDPLRDEGIAYADRLEAAGVSVARIHCPDMVHGFFRRLDSFDRAGQLVTEISEWLHADGAGRP